MIKLHFEKISRFQRKGEFVETALPFAKGRLNDAGKILVHDGDLSIQPQTRVTAKWPDGSIKWVHLSFLADLPANAGKDYLLSTDGGEINTVNPVVTVDPAGRIVNTGVLEAVLASKGSSRLFDRLAGPASFRGEEMEGPVLTSGGRAYTIKLEGDWRFCETGPYRIIAENSGKHYDPSGESLFAFTVRLYFTAGHPWFGLEYRFSHQEAQAELPLESLVFRLKEQDPDAHVTLGVSNYRTSFSEAKAGEGVEKLINADHLLYEANEQIPETLYGTFFADWRTKGKGLCATIFQAQQNFPKAMKADSEGLKVFLMPRREEPLGILRGMEKTHYIYFHVHGGAEDINELNIRSLQFQLPDRPIPATEVFKSAGVLENVFMDTLVPVVESNLLSRADSTGKAYGMLCWGDAVDSGYTEQGRGKGKAVWTNNEYDYPHANMLMFARTGERRFLDKLFAAARHWMDVDICHCSDDPLRLGAQIIHSARHVTGTVAPSHEWVEGLLDYYHLTAERRAFDCALGIGENILRILETPQFQQKGEINARETGWALRSLTALYIETGDSRWLEKCDWIVGHFVEWKKEFGLWLSPYTSHSAIRVPFMISVAVNSLMRYYRVRPQGIIKEMIIAAMDDLLENARLPDGQFYYKELPSLRHVSVNTIGLEALSYAYELTGDKKYLEGGLPVFRAVIGISGGGSGNKPMSSKKQVVEDAVIAMGNGTKSFAQSHIPIAVFTRAIETAGMLDRI
jgi:hypothetical protein